MNLLKPPSIFKEIESILSEEKSAKDEYYKTHEYRHNPSSASIRLPDGRVIGACLRQLYYKAIKQPVSNPSTLTNFLQNGFGDSIHEFFLGKLAKSKAIKITTEVKGKVLVDPLTREISYRVDADVEYDGIKGGFELKTMQSFAVQKLLKEGGYREDHLPQVISYFELKKDLSFYSIGYVARDSALRTEVQIIRDGKDYWVRPILPEKPPVKLNGINFTEIVKRWAELEVYITANKVPPRDFKAVLTSEGKVTEKRVKAGVEYKTDFKCNYCDYCDYCWSQEGAKKDAKLC